MSPTKLYLFTTHYIEKFQNFTLILSLYLKSDYNWLILNWFGWLLPKFVFSRTNCGIESWTFFGVVFGVLLPVWLGRYLRTPMGGTSAMGECPRLLNHMQHRTASRYQHARDCGIRVMGLSPYADAKSWCFSCFERILRVGKGILHTWGPHTFRLSNRVDRLVSATWGCYP